MHLKLENIANCLIQVQVFANNSYQHDHAHHNLFNKVCGFCEKLALEVCDGWTSGFVASLICTFDIFCFQYCSFSYF